MAAPYHSIRHKAEDALATYISEAGGISGVTVYKGESGSTISHPSLAIVCPSYQVERDGNLFTGNCLVQCELTLRFNADDSSRATIQTAEATLMDLFVCNDLPADLNGLTSPVTDFTAHTGGWGAEGLEVSTETNDAVYEITLSGGLLCQPS